MVQSFKQLLIEKKRYVNNLINPCVFIKKFKIIFAIVAIYIDDLNFIGTLKELSKAASYLKNKFEMINILEK